MKVWAKVAIGGACAVALAAVACPTLREGLELASDGGVRVLRERVRPAQAGPRLLLFAYDGVGAGEFRRALDLGYLRRISGLLGRDLPRARPLLRVVLDSQLRIPLDSRMVREAGDDLVVVGTSAASPERRRALESRGATVLTFDGPGGRADLRRTVAWLGERKHLSLMIEAGSKVNWTALDSGVVDKIFFYYGPKILGGMQSLPMAGGIGRRRRSDAILIRHISLHPIPPDEFAVEGYLCSRES